MLAWVALALAQPVFVVEDPEHKAPFIVVDARGERVGAWHFAHFTREHEVVDRLRSTVYGQRIGVITALGAGVLAFATGSVYIAAVRDVGSGDFQPDVAAAGGVAAGGFLLTLGGLALARHQPKALRVDSHWSEHEARSLAAMTQGAR